MKPFLLGLAFLAVFFPFSPSARAIGISAALDGGAAYPLDVVSGPISPKLGLQLGALVNNRTGFGGVFLDRYVPQNTWNVGLLFKQYFGPSRIAWFHVKVDALTYLVWVTRSSGGTVSGAWYDLIGAGAAVGARLFQASALGLEPYVGIDTFISPASLATSTLQRYVMPSAGVKLVMELGGGR